MTIAKKVGLDNITGIDIGNLTNKELESVIDEYQVFGRVKPEQKKFIIKYLKKQGHVNEIKEVSDGYATNYLIKNGYAVKYTKTSSDILNKDLEQKKKLEDNELKKANDISNKLSNVTLKFVVKSNNGKVFGSVSSKQICDELNKIGYSIDKKMIKLDNSLNSLGVHNVCINLHKSVSCDISVMLVEK